MLLLLLAMSVNQFFWVGLLHTLWISMGIVIGIFSLVRQLHLGQIVFGLLPHHPKIHHRDYTERIPSMPKHVVLHRHVMI